jgi:hypothetical protein
MLKSSSKDRSDRKEISNVPTGGNIILITDTLSDSKYPNYNFVKDQVNKFY